MEIPKSDFDFESANAKFNKEDLIKEAIASGSPLDENPTVTSEDGNTHPAAPARKDSLPQAGVAAYNKSSSFFDNISSEAKDREEANDARANGRQLRGEEFKKNIETFGQGNVDGGYRGRGRGGYGRGRAYGGTYRGGYGGGGRGHGGNFRGGSRGRGAQASGAVDQ
jgi:protein LSM14